MTSEEFKGTTLKWLKQRDVIHSEIRKSQSANSTKLTDDVQTSQSLLICVWAAVKLLYLMGLERQPDWKIGEKEKKNLASDRSDIRVDERGTLTRALTCWLAQCVWKSLAARAEQQMS